MHVSTSAAVAEGAWLHRGGGEYGLDWWEGGRLHKKQNGFDDFASCAQYLHSAGYSSPAKLTIEVPPALLEQQGFQSRVYGASSLDCARDNRDQKLDMFATAPQPTLNIEVALVTPEYTGGHDQWLVGLAPRQS